MTSLGPTSDDLVAWDTNHLTVKSSRYVMEPVVKAMVAAHEIIPIRRLGDSPGILESLVKRLKVANACTAARF
jgi:hypothetical protein